MQPVDLTTLTAICDRLNHCCTPAKLEQVHQSDRHTLHLGLRTMQGKNWLTISWHPQAARLHLSDRLPNQPDTFTFSQQIWHQVTGLALVAITLVNPWERVVDLQFAQRPGEMVQWHLYAEIMGKYSNLVLVNANGAIVTAAHQVSESQSRVRPIQTGQPYELPPPVLATIPKQDEPFDQWRDRLALIPQPIKKSLLSNYVGLSSALVHTLLEVVKIDRQLNTVELSDRQWQNLFQVWQYWLDCLTTKNFTPVWCDRKTYTMLGGISAIAQKLALTLNHTEASNLSNPEAEAQTIHTLVGVGVNQNIGGDRYALENGNESPTRQDISNQNSTSDQLLLKPEQMSGQKGANHSEQLSPTTGFAPPAPIAPIQTYSDVSDLLRQYYTWHLNQQEFKQLHHQINQAIQTHLAKLNQKLASFSNRLQQSSQADLFKQQADLLMANLQQWQPGMSSITLPDFVSNEPVEIGLNPEKNAAQNAQLLYKKHQKQKRAKHAILPLIEEVQQEINYLEQVLTAANQAADIDAPQQLIVSKASNQKSNHSISQAKNCTKDRLAAIDLDPTTTAITTLREVLQELGQQGYLKKSFQVRLDQGKKQAQKQAQKRSKQKEEPLNCHIYQSPGGFEIWVGRNNFQNDRLTFRVANQYDLWFHTQEIPGSHVLLRLEPGAVASQADLQAAANLAAYYSKARQSEQAPVVYTEPKHVYKPKGVKPGMVIYKHEQVIWGQPLVIESVTDSVAIA
ncbi:Fibronectin-binding A domain protein [Thalassoporum mexicanum PCC 7367]|uniref:Rqc2 family fibronectin-binding protein n=1 Tax=Thalassoporum mexicanum TaxID=3457544 RepID=UPI00029FFFDD|nr:NFACT RNA binding domain-containing protein [Pseudanabaena sp. PCC 7367]AFY71067.1 Fibronectin-binding A domain protein [Pseudanabaena sp. PCC 7367]